MFYSILTAHVSILKTHMNYIIFDLESTCWKEKNNQTREIIEIGAVKVGDDMKIIDEFTAFIKPVVNPELSAFCTELTSITQKMVDDASTFPVVIGDFMNWIDTESPYVLCSWGFYDKTQLKSDCKLHNIAAHWVDTHISLKHQFSDIKRLRRPPGMKTALKMEKLALTGTHHRGIDDARNISRIFIKNFEKWEY